MLRLWSLLFVFLLFPLSAQAEGTSLCCSCRVRTSDELVLNRAQSKADCRHRAGPFTRFSQCQPLQVLGDLCSFTSVTRGNKEFNCQQNKIFYLEDGQKKELLPGTAMTANPCTMQEVGAAQGVRQLSAVNPLDISSPDFGQKAESIDRTVQAETPDSDIYWTCGRDPADDSQCVAQHFQGKTVVTSMAKRLPPGPRACTPKVCSVLFESSFAPLRIDYVQGTP